MAQRIILRDLQKPKEIDLLKDIEWLGNTFGFSTGRDTKNVATGILKHVLLEVAKKGSTSSEEIAEKLGLSIQRVNYHLKSLIESGFFIREKRLILIRQGSVKAAVEEIQRDANRIFNNIFLIAEEIDAKLGFKNRY